MNSINRFFENLGKEKFYGGGGSMVVLFDLFSISDDKYDRASSSDKSLGCLAACAMNF